MISVMKLVTNFIKSSKLGVKVQGLTESSKNRLADVLQAFISVDNTRKNEVCRETVVMEGAEELTLRAEEQGTLEHLCQYIENTEKKKWRPPCKHYINQSKEKEWIKMHEKLKEVCKQIGVRRSARRSRNERQKLGTLQPDQSEDSRAQNGRTQEDNHRRKTGEESAKSRLEDEIPTSNEFGRLEVMFLLPNQKPSL